MKITRTLAIMLTLMVPLSVFAANTSMMELAKANAGKKIAIVSVNCNNYLNILKGWPALTADGTIQASLRECVELYESLLTKEWDVVPVASFVASPEYQALAKDSFNTVSPVFDGNAMVPLGANKKALYRSVIDKTTAGKLCEITGADLVMVIFTEWTILNNAGFQCTAAVNNAATIYDASGKQLYADGSNTGSGDVVGPQNLPKFNADTLVFWKKSFLVAMCNLYDWRRTDKDGLLFYMQAFPKK